MRKNVETKHETVADNPGAERKRRTKVFHPVIIYLRITDSDGTPVTNARVEAIADEAGRELIRPYGIEFFRLHNRASREPGVYSIELKRAVGSE